MYIKEMFRVLPGLVGSRNLGMFCWNLVSLFLSLGPAFLCVLLTVAGWLSTVSAYNLAFPKAQQSSMPLL